ncbi:sulfatase family protein [Joostella sp.]|uniref:sulfatase family protein n=1 Tax=Joostella sp. TaxID=2231138 RepID=UPI003A94ADBB
MKNILYLLAIILCLGACKKANTEVTDNAKSNKQKTNIVLILADDLGYGDLEVYNQNSKIPTPNLNTLAESGIRFTDAHSPSSVCTPTRYGILTGQYAWRTSLKKGVLWPWDPPLIDPDRKTIPRVLKEKGYNTACIGKWHLGWKWRGIDGNIVNDTIVGGDYGMPNRNTLWDKIDYTKPVEGGPIAVGFDTYFGDDVPNFPPYTFISDDKLEAVPNIIKPDTLFGNPGPMVEGWDLRNVMATITKKAVSYIENQEKEESPFFLYFPLTAPHTPIAPADEFIGKSEAGPYGDYVNQVDYTVGQVVEALKRTGQLENTLIVFTSDNGSPQRDGSNMGGKIRTIFEKYDHNPSEPFTGVKADIWEGGHRVPFIVSWPSKIKSKQESNQLISSIDILATIEGIIDTDEDKVHDFDDSKDFSKVWLGTSAEKVRDYLVLHSISGMFAIRNGDWKYIQGQGSGGWTKRDIDDKNLPGQLYNLKNDFVEEHNLYTENKEIVDVLDEKLEQYKKQGNSIE